MKNLTELTEVKMDSRGRMVVPAQIRKLIGLKIREEVTLNVADGRLEISTVPMRAKGVYLIVSNSSSNQNLGQVI
jgi:looped-hinge helix DNA binding domain, AbrB family